MRSLLLFPAISLVNAITVYNTYGVTSVQSAAATATQVYYGALAYNPIVLAPPPVPTPAPPTNFEIPLQNGADTGLSIKHNGAFFGISIEITTASPLIGINGTLLQPAFLNLMSNIQDRAGSVNVRVGGHSADFAVMVYYLPDGIVEYISAGYQLYTPDFIYMLNNVSSLLNVNWYLAIPFDDPTNTRTEIAAYGRAILGDRLIGLQVGDEPDVYASQGIRPYTYTPHDYATEFGQLVQRMNDNTNATLISGDLQYNTALSSASNILMGPNVESGDWTPEMVWNTGFVDSYKTNLAALTVEHYPDSNCGPYGRTGQAAASQAVFSSYLNHTAAVDLVDFYLNSADVAQNAELPLLMLETNTATCGGFPGVSDSFGAALWALDYALQMAWGNFSGAFFHNGGRNVSYNLFTAPPDSGDASQRWTIGPLYYSALAMAEALGSSNASQVLDLKANGNNIYTPAYGIYENSTAMRVALFNYITDPTGASDYIANITVASANSNSTTSDTPATVYVKYMNASSVSQKVNITWAGQTFGTYFQSDGIPVGNIDLQTVSCPHSVCRIKVPAPSFALVFLTNSSVQESFVAGEIFETTSPIPMHVTPTLEAGALATSNGKKRVQGSYGSTSEGSTNGSGRTARTAPSGVVAFVAVVVAGAWSLRW